jgi:hypothetical protein
MADCPRFSQVQYDRTARGPGEPTSVVLVYGQKDDPLLLPTEPPEDRDRLDGVQTTPLLGVRGEIRR